MIELKIRLKSPQISIKNGLIPETHSKFPQGETDETMSYGKKAVANTIACSISPYSLLGWLRFGVTEALIEKGISVCSAYNLNIVTYKDHKEFVIQDTLHGYHRRGSPKSTPECVTKKGKQCIVSEMFGGFGSNHRVFSVLPVKCSPIDSEYTRGVKNVTGKGNFLTLAISPRSAVDGTPYATHEVNVIENLDAILFIKMYEPNPRMDVHIAMLMIGIDYLNSHKDVFEHQLGGGRTFGNGFIEPTFLPISLTRPEAVEYHSKLIKLEDKADDADGLSKNIRPKIEQWEIEKTKYISILDTELKVQKDLFGIDKKWWQTI